MSARPRGYVNESVASTAAPRRLAPSTAASASASARGTTPAVFDSEKPGASAARSSSPGGPNMVCVLPEPVWPYLRSARVRRGLPADTVDAFFRRGFRRRRVVAAAPRPRRGDSAKTGRRGISARPRVRQQAAVGTVAERLDQRRAGRVVARALVRVAAQHALVVEVDQPGTRHLRAGGPTSKRRSRSLQGHEGPIPLGRERPRALSNLPAPRPWRTRRERRRRRRAPAPTRARRPRARVAP